MHVARGVEPGQQPLCGGLFVTGGAVDLPGKNSPPTALVSSEALSPRGSKKSYSMA